MSARSFLRTTGKSGFPDPSIRMASLAQFKPIQPKLERMTMKNDDEKALSSRRNILKRSGLVAAAVGVSALTGTTAAKAATDVGASEKGKCATCRFWGGMRKVSTDGQTVSADGKGWCNNPASPAYQKQTNPTQGAPVWTKWEALS